MEQQMQSLNSYVNPQDLENSADFQDPWLSRFDQFAIQPNHACVPSSSARTSRSQDSAIDLTSYTDYSCVKTEDDSFNTFLNTSYSTPASNTPSPDMDMVFSNRNSPGDFPDQSQTSSPETSDASLGNDTWPAIHIPQPAEQVNVSINLDKTKTRAETQIKTLVTVDPLAGHFQWVRFPRQTLSKSKQLASDEEVEANEKKDSTARLELTLVLATAVEKPEDLERAYRRARGAEKMPQRPRNIPVTELDKGDPSHPQNGGAVIICEGCKEREAKRYNRKKKRNAEEEAEWNRYEDDRIIMINEKEFKRWQDMDADQECSQDAKKVEFVMRITCYCRHQEDKSPVGYRVIFTFKDTNGNLIAQETSDIIQITDDHKNKENPVEAMGPLTIPTGAQDQVPSQYTVPMYDYSPTVYNGYSLPSTPVVSNTPGLTQSQSMFFPREAQYSRMANSAAVASQVPHHTGMGFCSSNIPAPTPTPQYATHQRGQSYFMPTMLSPKAEQVPIQAGYPLQRPQSLDSFAQFNFQYSPQASYSQPQVFASQPPSRATSRPASPTWDQGRGAKKLRAVPGFMLCEDYAE